jgi:hypothetical protein
MTYEARLDGAVFLHSLGERLGVCGCIGWSMVGYATVSFVHTFFQGIWFKVSRVHLFTKGEGLVELNGWSVLGSRFIIRYFTGYASWKGKLHR